MESKNKKNGNGNGNGNGDSNGNSNGNNGNSNSKRRFPSHPSKQVRLPEAPERECQAKTGNFGVGASVG